MNKKVRKAVFPVGGLGTRFLPATKAIPKEMLPVASKPLIQYAFEEAVEAGIEEFIFVTGRNKNAINNHFDHNFELQSFLGERKKEDILAKVIDWTPQAGEIAFIPQREPAGLGHAVWCARNLIEEDEPFAVLLADEMVLAPEQGLLRQMVNAYNKVGGANIVAVAEVEKQDVSKYGIINPGQVIDNLVKINSMVEKPKPENAPSNISLTGRYILNGSIMKILDNTKKSVGGEVQLTDAMSKLLEKEDFYGCLFEGRRFDCGSEVGFLDANIAYALDKAGDKKEIQNILRKYL